MKETKINLMTSLVYIKAIHVKKANKKISLKSVTKHYFINMKLFNKYSKKFLHDKFFNL